MKKEFMYTLLIASIICIPSTYSSKYAVKKEVSDFVPARDGVVSEYDSTRDKKEVSELFKKNWHMFERSNVTNFEEFEPSLKDPECLKKRFFVSNVDNGRLKVLRSSDALVGLIFYSMGMDDKEPLIKRLAINKKFQKKGWGQYLLNYVINDLKKMGAFYVKIGVFPDNAPARKLYEKMGFCPVSTSSRFILLERLIVSPKPGKAVVTVSRKS